MLELASIIILGILAQWLAWRFKVPAILPLILVGLAVGPFAPYWMPHDWLHGATKWLNPIYNNEGGLFPDQSLYHFVELAIGIILFEGGLTLKRNEIKTIGPIILKLISLGSLVTFIGAAILAHFLVDLNWSISFLFAGLIIVTGPTVIAPILRNVPLKKDVANILKWEGILIDPIGALTAVLVYEFIVSLGTGHGGMEFTAEAFKHFLTLTLVGMSLGTIAAFSLREVIKRHWIPHYLLNVFTLAFVLAIFVGSGGLVPDSGLLTIVVMGTVLANIDLPNMEEILYFKESLAVLLISMLFILLAANVNITDLELLLNWRCIGLFLAVILVVRPLGVFMSTYKSSLSLKEKLFISWVGPRGIVAAGIASLFGSKLVTQSFPDAEYITPLVFMIVLGTVLLNATTAKLIARLLGVSITKSNGTLIIGANKASRLIAKYLHEAGLSVAMLDNNFSNIKKATEAGVMAFQSNIYSDELKDNVELNEMGYLMALTGSNDVNTYTLEKFGSQFGEKGSYRLMSEEEKIGKKSIGKDVLVESADYMKLAQISNKYPTITGIDLNTKEDLEAITSKFDVNSTFIPLFIIDNNEELIFLTSEQDDLVIEEGYKLVILGKLPETE